MRTATQHRSDRQNMKDAIAAFPETFRLRVLPDVLCAIAPSQCFVRLDGTVLLSVHEIKKHGRSWFATERELRMNIVRPDVSFHESGRFLRGMK